MAETVRSEVRVFARLMEERLKANDAKGGWKKCTLSYLANRLHQEFEDELLPALLDIDGLLPSSWLTVAKEAADVANFAMMIADRAYMSRGFVRGSS